MNVGRFLLGVPFALACVNGGDDSTAKPQGSLGGPCFANNTCNAGLDCVLQNGSGICEQGDATIADSPTNDVVVDQSNDVSTNDAGDGGVEAESGCNDPNIAYPCSGATCSGSESCCESSGQCSTTCTSGPLWVCETKSNCGANSFCCVSVVTTGQGCPMTGTVTLSSDIQCAQQVCPTNTYATCKTNAECPSPNTQVCTPVQIANFVLGFCM